MKQLKSQAALALDRHETEPDQVLQQVFGFPTFRGLQEQVVRHVTAGGDALVLMPTGGGKSICYQVPALSRPGMAIIVSPLIALMDDQVAGLRQLGVAAGALHSDLDPEEAARVARDMRRGALDLLYVSPERLLGTSLLERLTELPLALFAIDEAHCVSQWGHEFRPEYRNLAVLGERFPGVPRIALTATADPRTRDDILVALGMRDARLFAASFHRPNLHIAAAAKASEASQLVTFLRRHSGECGIVYCGSRAKTERVAERLCAARLPAVAFHAGLDAGAKRAAAARFRSGEPMIVVATIAFGMGIDRPDVRFVVHLDMPDSPEGYYQQIGRAGRDGEPAETLLLYGGEDIARARHWLLRSSAPDAQLRVMRARLEAMIQLTETTECRTAALLACFGERLEGRCGHCDTCAEPLRRVDGTVAAQKVLSAIVRTGQMFGAVHIASVLRGERTEQIARHGHDRLPTFGIGKDKPAGFWRSVIRQLVALGAVDVDVEGHGGLRLVAERARGILRGEQVVSLREDTTVSRAATTARERAGRPGDVLRGEVQALFEALRQWRLGIARTQNLPPYVIFHDSVLAEIAQSRPATPDQLSRVKGVGTNKLALYGPAILGVLKNFRIVSAETRAAPLASCMTDSPST